MTNPVPSQLTPYPDFNSFFCKLPEEEQKKVIPPQGTQILEETNPNPESRRNSPSPFFVSFSQNFFTDNNRKWYYLDKQGIAQFIAEIIVFRVTFIFQSDKDLPLALSVYYYSGNRLSSTSFTFSLFNSDSLYKEFYIREYSSSCPVKIRNDLLRYCIANARYVTRFNLPQYMGWISARSNLLFAASDYIDPDLLEYCSPEIRKRRIAPLKTPIESEIPDATKEFFFLLVLRCSSILLTFYAEQGLTPDCIFLIENTAGIPKPALLSLLSNTGGCTPHYTFQKKNRAALLQTLNTTNDGLAVIHFDEAAKYELQDIHQVLTEDLQRMMNSGSRPLHIPILISENPSSVLCNEMYCPIRIDWNKLIASTPFHVNYISSIEANLIQAISQDSIQPLSHFPIIPKNLQELINKHPGRNNMFYIFKNTIDILQSSQLLKHTIDSQSVFEILDNFVDSSDFLHQITDEFSNALNKMIDQNEISFIERNAIRSKEQSEKAIIVKNDRFFVEQNTFSDIIRQMALSSNATQVLKALDACGLLIHTNGLQDPLQILDATGKKILLRTYCFTISILSESLQKRISFPSNDEYADYILSSDDVPSDEFLPIIQCGSGGIAGRLFQKDKEANNHMLITGFSGYGKTYALCHLAMRLKHLGHKVIAFDSTGSFSKERIMKHLPQSIVDANFVFHNIEDDGLPVDVFYTSESEMKNRIERITGLLSAGAANVTSSQMASLSSVLIKIKDEQITPESILSELSQTHASKIIKRRYEALLQALAQYTSADLHQSWNDFLGKSEIIIVCVPTLYAQERNALVDILLASLFNYQKQNSNQPLDLLIDELQNENTTEQSPLDQIIAVGRNHAMSIIAATQHFKLNQRLKTMIGNIDTKLFFRPTSNSEDTVIQYLNHRKLSRDYLMKMERGDCILEGNLYNKSRNTNQHAVIIGHFLDYTE